MKQLKVRQALTAGTVYSLFAIAYITITSSDHLYAFVATTVVCSVVMLASAVIFRSLARSGRKADD